MRRLTLLYTFIILLSVFSCHKKEETIISKELPVWLKLKITELIPDQQMCEITDVTFIEYNGKRYYHVYCAIWSCMYCQLFDEQGNRPNWNSDGWNDFITNEKNIQTVPACE